MTGNAKVALKDYYDTVHTLCEAQTYFAASTKVLEEKIQDKAVFLDIIKQVQLPAVRVSIRNIEEIEKMEGKKYRELTLLQNLPNFRTIYPNADEQTRTMAAFMYYVLYNQITGLQKAQTGLAIEFQEVDHREEAARWTRQVKHEALEEKKKSLWRWKVQHWRKYQK